ncbi:DNA-binding transcriptional regulator, MarR family [Aliiroseovarius halocynthiae]|uniref:MarR family transcriptional regulator n=1 Tax=Aliiroseovarius halocynthiae TaxID=985055 RepID=A0A545SZT1_9RHOB|nr:MarR family transcriptional regulator [Aliiroseovarius halocynthiae]TQV70477.1 MarR family transcriptional regulator [Aliiroseovarius halocynthiae]SMR81801.1 DNA-binding transcriptional regulator, MarR family [Aliiroseovarius halocynthiae]
MTKKISAQDTYFQLCFEISGLHRSMSRFYQRAFEETGLTYAKYIILVVLENSGPQSVSELSQRAGVEANTLSPLLKKMAGFGTLTRQRAEDDERRVEIAISDKGQKMLDRAKMVVFQGLSELDIDADALDGAIRLFSETRTKLDAIDPPRLHFTDMQD